MVTSDLSLKTKILLTMTAGDSHSLGNVWRISAKKNDFYLEAASAIADVMHLSVHGPQDGYDDPGFFLRVDKKKAAAARDNGYVLESSIPRRGLKFSGEQVARGVFHVVRLRWGWDLQRERFREFVYFGDLPEPGPTEQGFVQRVLLKPNQAWDVDLYVSYNDPYWPTAAFANSSGDPRLGPLRNDAGHWLTGQSRVRSQVRTPTPANIRPRLPAPGETPNRITCLGLGPDGQAGIYWFVEAVTAREVMKTWSREQPGAQ